MAKTNHWRARVDHLVRSAEIAHKNDFHGARDRFLQIAIGILNEKRVPGADEFWLRIGNIGAPIE